MARGKYILFILNALKYPFWTSIKGPLHLVFVYVHTLLIMLVLQVTLLDLGSSFGLGARGSLLGAETAGY